MIALTSVAFPAYMNNFEFDFSVRRSLLIGFRLLFIGLQYTHTIRVVTLIKSRNILDLIRVLKS